MRRDTRLPQRVTDRDAVTAAQRLRKAAGDATETNRRPQSEGAQLTVASLSTIAALLALACRRSIRAVVSAIACVTPPRIAPTATTPTPIQNTTGFAAIKPMPATRKPTHTRNTTTHDTGRAGMWPKCSSIPMSSGGRSGMGAIVLHGPGLHGRVSTSPSGLPGAALAGQPNVSPRCRGRCPSCTPGSSLPSGSAGTGTDVLTGGAPGIAGTAPSATAGSSSARPPGGSGSAVSLMSEPVSYTHLRAHETGRNLV